MKIFAIVPARSLSQRFKNKNIALLGKAPLFMHSINFAKKLKFVSKIIFSTDSKKYIQKIKKKSNIIIHKRSKKASSNFAMEEDILQDIIKDFKKKNMQLPNRILWLRPTHPLRSKSVFEEGYKLFKKFDKTVMIVHKEESRLFANKNKFLLPINKKMKNRSMIRSQECDPLYSIFSGEFFKMPKIITKNFLGKKKMFVISPKITKVDIDTINDLNALNNNIRSNKSTFKKYLHD